MNLNQIGVFVKVAENNSFSKTAKELHLTQSTVSTHILSLEKELGVKLFIRSTREVMLTGDGRKLYKYARQMVKLQSEMEGMFLDMSKTKKRISIAASSVPAQYLLPDIMCEYGRRYTNTSFKIVETDSAGVVDSIVENYTDIGFTGTIIENKVCKYIPFFNDEIVIITPNTEHYTWLLKSKEGIKWILDEPVIMREQGSGTRREAEKQIKKSGIDPDSLNIIASIRSSEAIKRSVRSGVGISVISKLAVQEEVNAGELLEFPFSSEGLKRTINIVYNKAFPLLIPTKRFIKVARELYGGI